MEAFDARGSTDNPQKGWIRGGAMGMRNGMLGCSEGLGQLGAVVGDWARLGPAERRRLMLGYLWMINR
jgi:hypothetical protein